MSQHGLDVPADRDFLPTRPSEDLTDRCSSWQHRRHPALRRRQPQGFPWLSGKEVPLLATPLKGRANPPIFPQVPVVSFIFSSLLGQCQSWQKRQPSSHAHSRTIGRAVSLARDGSCNKAVTPIGVLGPRPPTPGSVARSPTAPSPAIRRSGRQRPTRNSRVDHGSRS